MNMDFGFGQAAHKVIISLDIKSDEKGEEVVLHFILDHFNLIIWLKVDRGETAKRVDEKIKLRQIFQ